MARTIAVVGNGIIGHGIAEIFAGAGWRVVNVDLVMPLGRLEEAKAEGNRD